jgi:hypothetical protein
MLKYLSNRYGIPYAVQPLPVSHMGVTFDTDGKAVISWKETEDPVEPTAKASGFILYTRIDDGAFDMGKEIKAMRGADGKYRAEVSIEPGHIYSFRISAFNEGGKSFDSETVSIGSNFLAGENGEALAEALLLLEDGQWKKCQLPERWDGRTAERIVQTLLEKFD